MQDTRHKEQSLREAATTDQSRHSVQYQSGRLQTDGWRAFLYGQPTRRRHTDTDLRGSGRPGGPLVVGGMSLKGSWQMG